LLDLTSHVTSILETSLRVRNIKHVPEVANDVFVRS
jgi:hypothetical protein